MAKLTFESLSFEQSKSFIKVKIYILFYFIIPRSELIKIDPEFKIEKNSIIFPSINQATANHKFNFLIQKYIPELKNSLNNKPTIYVHKNSGISLIGSNVFGIIDRNTSIIEVRPITGCNLDCIYCSVDEGKSSKKARDFVVEKEYLLEELKKLIKFKQIKGIEIHIGTQGEPLLYEPLLEFIKELKKIPKKAKLSGPRKSKDFPGKQIKTISVNTNGLLFTKKSIDQFVKAGLNQINLSINTLNKEKASKIANTAYNINYIIEIAKYAAKKVNLRIAPVLMDKINNKDIEEIVKFAKSINAKLGIQNFLYYPKGRKPCKQLLWSRFYDILTKLEQKYKVHLILNERDFNIVKTKKLPKPFKNNMVIKARIVCPGRYKNEFIAAAKDRNITVYSKKDLRTGSLIRIKIKRSKHNIFSAIPI